jgi:hypothetical protein
MNDRMMSISDLVVTDYHDNVTNFPEKNTLFKSRSLYENGMNFTEKFWETNNSFPLSEKEERILQFLKEN